MPARPDAEFLRPMLATTAEAPLDSPALAYEPKYDGIRALASITPSPSPSPHSPSVRLWSRLGNEKTTQFPEIAAALAAWARTLDRDVILDGEVVALNERGEPAGFQNLQGRIHLKDATRATKPRRHGEKMGLHGSVSPWPVSYIAFDVLRDGDEDLRALPLHARRARLERLLASVDDPRLRISEQSVGDGRALYERAQREGWEGLVAKRLDAPYRSGKRTPDWCKLKLVRHQACVVGGWTAPRGSRPFLGALLLGIYDASTRDARSGQVALEYIGHTGAGFSDAELGRVWKRLQALKTKTSPFAQTPKTNERPTWTRPEMVVEVKFTEWTADGKLRHPTYLGMRDDLKPASIHKEPDLLLRPTAGTPGVVVPRQTAAERAPRSTLTKGAIRTLLERLDEIEDGSGSGTLDLPGGHRLEVSNLGKVFWPGLTLTKGDLMRHYVRVAPMILPVLADRPLVMKRYPNGVAGKPFYQHRAPDTLPPGVRVALVGTGTERRPHLVGGDLITLLYTAQLGAISQDPWFSRAGFEPVVDHVAIDLDPPEGLPFARVLDVARWVRDELDGLGAAGFAKTSGSSGVHIYVPMPPDTPYGAGLLFCQIVATMVAKKHPKVATVERSIAARGRRIYVDYLQNILGKTLASAYSARANDFAGVSTPLTWEEVEGGVSPKDFTIRNFAGRLETAGDLWGGLRKARGANLRAVMRYAEP